VTSDGAEDKRDTVVEPRGYVESIVSVPLTSKEVPQSVQTRAVLSLFRPHFGQVTADSDTGFLGDGDTKSFQGFASQVSAGTEGSNFPLEFLHFSPVPLACV